MNHVVAFVRPDIVTEWEELMVGRSRIPLPFVYGSDALAFNKRVKPCTTLWVFMPGPDGTPPSLYAKLAVVGRFDLGYPCRGVLGEVLSSFDYDYIAVGDRNRSCFFGYNDASRTLRKLIFGVKEGACWALGSKTGFSLGSKKWVSSFGSRFHQPRVVAPRGWRLEEKVSRGAKALETLEEKAKASIFISWKWSDDKEEELRVRGLAKAIAKQGMFAWLDHFVIPGFSPEEGRGTSTLKRLLRYGLRRCSVILAVASQKYGTRTSRSKINWTRAEWRGDLLALGQSIKRVVFNPDGLPGQDLPEGADIKLTSVQPAAAARELKDYLVR